MDSGQDFYDEHTIGIVEAVVRTKVDITIVTGPRSLQGAARFNVFLGGGAVEPSVDGNRGANGNGAADSGVVNGNVTLVDMLWRIRQQLRDNQGKRIYQGSSLREGSKAQGSETENVNHCD